MVKYMKNRSEKKLVQTISRRDYSSNVKRNLLSVLSIIITTFLITIVFSLGKAYWNGITQRSVMMDGAVYDVQLPEPTEEQIGAAQNLELIKNAGAVLKCAIMDKYEGLQCGEVRFYWCDEIAWEKQFVPAFEYVEGSYPIDKNEIMLSMKALKKLGIKNPQLGMHLTGISYNNLSSNNRTYTEDMILSGFFKDYSGELKGYVSKEFCDKTGARLTDLTQGILNITLKKHIYNKNDIKELGESLDIDDNQIIYADLQLKDNFIKMMIGLAAFMLIILVSGYLFIYNVMYISTSRKIQFYGQLKTIGFTNLQINSIINRQMSSNLFAGIFGGLLLGGMVSICIMPITMKMVGVTANNMDVFQPVIIIGSAMFSGIVVLVCTWKIKKLLRKISPIAASKFNILPSVKKKKSVGKGRIIDMVNKNVFRDKKQAVIIFVSLTLAFSAFFMVNVLVEVNSAKNILDEVYAYDYRVRNESITTEQPVNRINRELIDNITNLNGIEQVWEVLNKKIVIPYNEDTLGEYYKRVYASPVSTGDYESDMELYKVHPENENFMGNLVGISENEFDSIIRKLDCKIDKQEFLDGSVAIIKGTIGISPKEVIGKKLDFIIDEYGDKKKCSVKIVADYSIYRGPNYFAAGIAPDIIVSERYMKKLLNEPVVELLDIIYKTPFNKALDKDLDLLIEKINGLSTDSKMTDYEELKSTENQLKTIGWILCSALAVIALINYGNIMAAGIEERRVELAILRSIGMTPRQVIKMLILEGTEYGLISVLFAGSIGIPLSYAIFKVMDKYGMDFNIPLCSNIVVSLCILILCVLIPNVLYRFIPSKSVIEVLKEEG